jgi:hypothetical protein
MNVLASAGGPAVAVYAAGSGWDATRTRATLQAYFLALNVVTVLTLGPPHEAAGRLAVLVVVLAIGLAAGSVVSRHVSTRLARSVTLSLAAAGGLAVLASALIG